MSNLNFAFADDYVMLTDEELATIQGGKSIAYNVGRGVGEFVHGVVDGFQSWF